MAENTGADTREVTELSFKEASVELERIVRSLEEGDLELEEALARYGRGVALLTSLRERLADARNKVSLLVEEADNATPDVTGASLDD